MYNPFSQHWIESGDALNQSVSFHCLLLSSSKFLENKRTQGVLVLGDLLCERPVKSDDLIRLPISTTGEGYTKRIRDTAGFNYNSKRSGINLSAGLLIVSCKVNRNLQT
ncbi:hypothetical protein XENTR_v10016148 [Xenopus tropicalis]|nr:hypothetical protein XENTR_v10016148 [Xenopus tropicalis]